MIIIDRIKRLIKYIPVLWRDFDFDFRPGFYNITKVKLTLLLDSDCKYKSWTEKEQRRIKESIELCKRLAEDWDWEEEKWHNEHEPLSVKNKSVRKQFWRMVKRVDKKKEFQKERLFYILNKYGHSWWL